MLDIFHDSELQRDELLARIAEGLQLDDTRRARLEQAYQAIGDLLNAAEGLFQGLKVDVYPHGSAAIGTTCKPLRGNEFDLDIVIHVHEPYIKFTPKQLLNAVKQVLEADGRYRGKIELKRRCVRINYAGDFHLDILPGCIIAFGDPLALKVPDRSLDNWVDSSPKGFAGWFIAQSKLVKESLLANYFSALKLRASVQDIPKESFYNKTPLQRSVQLVKHYRDRHFEKDSKYATSSIVLTTLFGLFYAGEPTIYSTIENVLNKVQSEHALALSTRTRFKVFNPTNPNEEFTDKWTLEHYRHFLEFVGAFAQQWQALKRGASQGADAYNKLFGSSVYRGAFEGQLKELSKFSLDRTAQASSLILSQTALTDPQGRINSTTGVKNEPHRNFGG